MTCKKKRLKCDETKPTCIQCEKRGIECAGYNKDFKWRSFEDTTKQARPRRAKARKIQDSSGQKAIPIQVLGEPGLRPNSSESDEENSWSLDLHCAPQPTTRTNTELSSPTQDDDCINSEKPISSSDVGPLAVLSSGLGDYDDDLPSPLPFSDSLPSDPYENGSQSFSSLSLAPINNVRPMRNPPNASILRPPGPALPYEAPCSEDDIPLEVASLDHGECDEEIGRDQMTPLTIDMAGSEWRFKMASPTSSSISTKSSQATNVTLLKTPSLDPSSPEMLMLRFDKQTCGILSIKDGPTENPWRTLIWPLAQNSHALYHAISAMAALHGAINQPQLRLTGMAHMTKSISRLSADMHKMSLDQILASALALALSESWDDKISTGIHHLKGAKTLLNNALAQRSRSLQLGQWSRQDARRLKFLSNTYVYLAAIARLTSSAEDDNTDLEDIVQTVNEPMGSGEHELDPLMGCATALFPLLGKVASLIQRIRKTRTNSLSIVSEANELREQLLQWEPPDMDLFEQPEDPSSNARHALQTAEAYRRAILLHLHSAAPELSSEPSHDQAKGTLMMLAATPLSSRTMVVQIFPLLVGSCEMVNFDDRQWVTQRWDAMMKRLTLVNVSSCWEIVKEVWRRRDQCHEFQARRMSRMIGRNVSPGQFIPRAVKRKMKSTDAAKEDTLNDTFSDDDDSAQDHAGQAQNAGLNFEASGSVAPRRQLVRLPRGHTDVSLLSGEIEYTVRGHLHWLGVMSDWGWEGKV